MLKRTLRASFFSGFCLLFGLTLHSVSQAANPDYTCYMQIGSTKVVDLTRSVCRFRPEEMTKTAAANAAYLNSVKKLVGSDERILGLIDDNPGLIIAAAENYCVDRESGILAQQHLEPLYRELMSASSQSSVIDGNSEQVKQYETTFMATALAVDFAPDYYCLRVTRR